VRISRDHLWQIFGIWLEVTINHLARSAVVVTPPETVPALIGERGSSAARAAVVITSGEVAFRGRATLLRRTGQVQNGKIQASGQVD